jgi:predicted peptidase
MRIACALAAMSALPLAGAPETGFLDRSITLAGTTHSYQVYVPREHDAGLQWPVIVSLHGGGRQGSDGLRPTEVGWAARIRADRTRYPVVVVFPQAAAGASWIDRAMADLVDAQLEKTLAEFNGDPDRVYLTGFSMGGAGVYRMAYRWPERFAALAAFAGPVEAGIGGPPQNREQHAARDRRSNPYTAEPDPFAALATRIRHVPIRIFHGDADDTVPVEQSRRMGGRHAGRRRGRPLHGVPWGRSRRCAGARDRRSRAPCLASGSTTGAPVTASRRERRDRVPRPNEGVSLS